MPWRHGVFAEQLNDYKSVQVTRIVHDFYETDPARGFYGGGGLDARPLWSATPILHALMGMPPDVPSWGAAFKDAIAHNFTRQMCVVASTTSLPLDRNNITLDPQSKDRWGRPGIRVTYRDHPDDIATAEFLLENALAILDAAGAEKTWGMPASADGGRRAPARHLPHGRRPGDLGRGPRPSLPRRPEPVHLRRLEFRDVRPRPAHHDHHGAGLSCRRPNPRRRSGQSHLGVPPMSRE